MILIIYVSSMMYSTKPFNDPPLNIFQDSVRRLIKEQNVGWSLKEIKEKIGGVAVRLGAYKTI